MIQIAFILAAIYFVGYRASRPNSVVPTRKRMMIYSVVVTLCVFFYAYRQSSKPPFVNYYATGWLFMIQDLNARYASKDNPNRIPDPGK